MFDKSEEAQPSEKNRSTDVVPADTMLDLAREFYRVFYRRNLDDAMASKIATVLQTSPNPIADFLENCASSAEFKTRELYVSVNGQYDTEAETCWFRQSATIVVKRHPVYVSIPHDYPTCQTLTIRTEQDSRVITLKPGEAHKIRNTSRLDAQAYSITAEHIYCPADYGKGDRRTLCFQVSAGNRNHIVVRNRELPAGAPQLVAVSGSLKERRVLAVIAAKLQEYGLTCPIFDERDSKFDAYIAGKSNLCFLIASSDTFFLCERRVDNARYIYTEHGIAPFKGYTYAAHYKNYDHVMLPGDFWKSRIEEIHGKLNSADIVGYSVISTVDMSRQDIDILFAPTWSHHFHHIRAAQSLVEVCVNAGLRVAYVGHPDSLTGLDHSLRNRLVPADDIYQVLGRSKAVITDFSSVGVEAAVLGIPVILMPIHSLDDFAVRLHQNGQIRVPYYENKIWNAGPLINESNIVSEFEKLMASKDYYAAERQEWIELCHPIPPKMSVELSARSVVEFLNNLKLNDIN
ncbi:MAG: hypothetical protein ACRYGO_19230 [Janthinobacterium lividum]